MPAARLSEWREEFLAGWAVNLQSRGRMRATCRAPAFMRTPEGNGCAERFIRTLKEQLPGLAVLPHRGGVVPGAA